MEKVIKKFEKIKIQDVIQLQMIQGGVGERTFTQNGSNTYPDGRTTWDLIGDDGVQHCDVPDGTTPDW